MVVRRPRRFTLGQVVSTPAALALLDANGEVYWSLLDRHISGDWGDLPDEDRQANVDAVTGGGRILSAYKIGTSKVWIITESDRSVTTLLLPDEH